MIKSKAFQNASFALGILCFVFAALLLLWLFRDARRRGTAGSVWTVIGVAVALVAALLGLSLSTYGFGPVGLFALVGLLFVALIYSFVRPGDYLTDAREQQMSLLLLEAQIEQETCPTCGHGIETKFLVCPYCNTTLRVACDFCGQPIKPEWTICPYCKANQRQHVGESALFVPPSSSQSYDTYDSFDDEANVKPAKQKKTTRTQGAR